MADSMQTTVLTVEPDGSIGADFSGHVEAEGIDLLAYNPAPEAEDRKVRWLRESDLGHTLAYLTTGDEEGGSRLRLVTLREETAFAGSGVSIQSGKGAAGNGFVIVDAKGSAGSKNATILRDNGLSSFLKLAAEADVRIAFGKAEVEYPGGSPESKVLTVEHGLGVTPIGVLATPKGTAVLQASLFSKTSFFLQARQWAGSSPAAGTKVSVSWVAIG